MFQVKKWMCPGILCLTLAGCASGGQRAPIADHSAGDKKGGSKSVEKAKTKPVETVKTVVPANKSSPPEKDWRPQTYVVQKGDTLYSIAFNYGLGYHDVAEINYIPNPDLIHIGQELRLFAVAPVAAKPAQAVEINPREIPVINQPKVAKLPYSRQAVADIMKLQENGAKTETVSVAKLEPKPESAAEIKPVVAVDTPLSDESIEWGVPSNGKWIGEFSESANRKGIDIGGIAGQPVVASAAGKVVYSGSGLRGYGKLVIIKHNNTYLSAYAHNNLVLVKEGQIVTKGQKIAEMGNTDSDQVKLHFEIRKFGKPVDPAKFLSLAK
jgi:lipoprotein NlpD